MVQLLLGLDAVSGTCLPAAPLRAYRRDVDWREALICSAERTRRWPLATACANWAVGLVHDQHVVLRHLKAPKLHI